MDKSNQNDLDNINLTALNQSINNIADEEEKKAEESNEAPSLIEKAKFAISFITLTQLLHNANSRPHWDEVYKGLILSALPIETKLGNHGDHGKKLIEQCKNSDRPLGGVFSVMKKFELKGEGLGLKPVSPKFWQDNEITHHLTEIQDFTGDVELKKIEAAVNKMHDIISNNKSVVVHCKAGRGRSWSLAMCYLIKYTDMNVTEALTEIHSKRSQVSPSQPQFDLVEKFRKEYCKNKAPLNIDSIHFQRYRKDIEAYRNSPWLHAVLAFFVNPALSLITFPVSWLFQSIRDKTADESYEKFNITDKSIDNNEAMQTPEQMISNLLCKLTTKEAESFKAGIESGTSWKGWIENSVTPVNYNYYLIGMRTATENTKYCQLVKKVLNKHISMPEPIELSGISPKLKSSSSKIS